jgi:hypothetical protein
MNDRPDDPIVGFWAWFKGKEKTLKNLRPDDATSGELGRQIAAIGADGWEIGPDLTQEMGRFFALSAQGDRERFRRNKSVIAHAPVLDGWKFFPAKPRKQWEKTFIWPDKGTIDASGWKFALYGYPDGMYDIALLGNALEGFDDVEQRRILAFVIESELGEALAIEKVCGLELHQTPTTDESKMSIEISMLFEFLMNQYLH